MKKLRKQTKEKLQVGNWVMIKTKLQNGIVSEIIELGKILAIEDHFGPFMQEWEGVEDPIGVLVQTAHGQKKWIMPYSLERIAIKGFGFSKKNIMQMEETLNKKKSL